MWLICDHVRHGRGFYYFYLAGMKMESMEIDNLDENSGGMPTSMENRFPLRPVSEDEVGDGLPYAPVNWPLPGDIWSWKVGKRVAINGHFLDRYLYLPKRLCLLESRTRRRHGFASKLSVEKYVRTAFPDADVKAFFSSFSWKIPSKKQPRAEGNAPGSHFFPIPCENVAEDPLSGTQSEGVACKAGNRKCNSLMTHEEVPLVGMSCDICCSEPHFCRACCCILCCKTINLNHGGYSYIVCNAKVDDGYICGHIAHISCSLRSYMAGTVGGTIGLDTEYYCRRCDARTDLIPHVKKLLKSCESVDSRDEVQKILNVGFCILRGSQRTSAKWLLDRVKLACEKVASGISLEDIWEVEENDADICQGVYENGNTALGTTDQNGTIDSPPIQVALCNYQKESMKLDDEIYHVLEALKKSHLSEYEIAEERLYDQKSYLDVLYQQLEKETFELSRCRSGANADNLLKSVMNKRNQINREIAKLKEMEKVAKGFGRTSKDILRNHFKLEIDD